MHLFIVKMNYSGVNAVGYSCLPSPSSGKTQQYTIFNTTAWYHMAAVNLKQGSKIIPIDHNYTCKFYKGEHYTEPHKLFIPANCDGSHVGDNYCMDSFCTCIAECTSLCTTNGYRTAFLSLSICFGVFSLLAIGSMFAYFKYYSPMSGPPADIPTWKDISDWFRTKFGWVLSLREDFRSNRRRAAAFDWRHLRLDVMVSTFLRAVEFNKLFRSFLPIWMLDTMCHLMFVCNFGLFVRYVIQPEYSIVPDRGRNIDCNMGIAVPGHDSDAWQVGMNSLC